MWLDRAVKWFLPRDERFFDLLDRVADSGLASSRLLVERCSWDEAESPPETAAQTLRDTRHQAALATAETLSALNKTFVTPLDRSDIYALASGLRELTEQISNALRRIDARPSEQNDRPDVTDLAVLIQKACSEIRTAVCELRDIKDPKGVSRHCDAIKDVTTQGREQYHARLEELYCHERDAIQLMRQTDLLSYFERALSACESVVRTLETVLIKNA